MLYKSRPQNFINKTWSWSALHPCFHIIREGYHADGLPDTQSYTRSNAAVETLNAIFFVDEAQSIHDRELSGSVGIGSPLGHGLHLG